MYYYIPINSIYYYEYNTLLCSLGVLNTQLPLLVNFQLYIYNYIYIVIAKEL